MTLVGNTWTLSDLTTEVSNFMDDASNARWSTTDVARAIRAAIRSAPPKWWEERLDDSNTYDEEDFRYDLPPACQRVEEVWFAPLSEDKPRYFVVPTVWHTEGTELVFTDSLHNYHGKTMYILYIVHPTNLLTLSITNGAIASATAVALTSSGETFITKGVRVGDAVIINETNYDGNGTYYVKSVDSETQLTLHKAPGATGTDLDCTVAQYTDVPVEYIIYYAAGQLFENAARNRPGVEIDQALTLARYYRSLAEIELNKQRKAFAGRRRY